MTDFPPPRIPSLPADFNFYLSVNTSSDPDPQDLSLEGVEATASEGDEPYPDRFNDLDDREFAIFNDMYPGALREVYDS